MLIFRKLAVCFSAIALVLSGCWAVFPKKIRGCWVAPGGQVAVFFDEHYIYYRDLLATSMDVWGKYTVSRSKSFLEASSVGNFSQKDWTAERRPQSTLWEWCCDCWRCQRHRFRGAHSKSERESTAKKQRLKPAFSRQHTKVFDLLTVSDDGQLHFTTAIGTEHEASYRIDKDTLELTFNGQRQGFQKQSLEVCRQRP